ncbi:hypothetical protein BTO30_02370 [Domibacillus antri]|uniref:40-residue YVTN family beta-propeller n=1 Tax=Domibacillus antri TaxID=1714264 RepID=A0A1Q8Q931_9BACI|nr:hypothetical protein [Domibacillus antri]OLN23811.1 hypothetical protein BTO30_02370 [Domibacillus antri]
MKRIMIILLFLAGCSQTSYTPVKENEFAAVLNIREPGLTFVDNDGSVISEWVFDELYTGGVLFPDGDTLLLYGTELDEAVLFSIRKGKELDRWEVPSGVTGAAYIEETDEVALSVKEDRSVHFFQADGKEIKSVRTGKYPMTMVEYNEKLYVINYQDTVLSEMNVHTHEVEREFAIPTSSAGLAVDESKKELWVGGHGYAADAGETIHIYSLETGSLTATADAPVMPVAFAGDNGFMYTVSHGSNMIHAFNPGREKVAEAEAPANPFTIASFAGHIISAGYDSGELSYYEKETLTLQKTIKIGEGPFMIFVKEGGMDGARLNR